MEDAGLVVGVATASPQHKVSAAEGDVERLAGRGRDVMIFCRRLKRMLVRRLYCSGHRYVLGPFRLAVFINSQFLSREFCWKV